MTAGKKIIDFEKELTEKDELRADIRQRLEGERNTAALKSSQSRFMPGSKKFIVLLAGISGIFGSVMVYKAYQAKSIPPADAPPPASVRNNLPPLKVNNEASTKTSEDY
jgi:hypothetical protein